MTPEIDSTAGGPATSKLIRFATQRGHKVKQCSVLDPNLGELGIRQVRFREHDQKIAIVAGEAKFGIGIDVETTIAVSFNAPDRVGPRRMPYPRTPEIPYPMFVLSDGDSSDVRQWLTEGRTAALLHGLALRADEALHIFKNLLTGVFREDINLEAVLLTLQDLASSLPKRVHYAEVVISRLPRDLRPLARFLPRYAVQDDEARSELIGTLKPNERAQLIATVRPMLGRINQYLDAFTPGRPEPAEALAVQSLAELVAELLALEEPGGTSEGDRGR